ncbi:hypothetical protein [Microcoleus sp. AT3-D2]|uniref:hypothetical protein n=1 Tax=Microcoleus sp. AT3-D2 TaxID=2818612 RepID=UPI002FD4B850
MAIPSVVQGMVEAEDGKVFELDSSKGSIWLESITSFRFEPTEASKPYTVRKESGKGGDYWYGYRKVAGRLHKKYVGKTSELSTAKLEEIAGVLNTPPQPRVTDKVTETSNREVTDKVTDTRVVDRLTALELQVKALQESLEALRSVMPGKSESLSDSPELLTPDVGVTDKELQSIIGNLQAENETLKADYAKLLESSTQVTNKLRQEVQELRSQLEVEKTRWDELREELDDQEETCAELRSEVSDLKQKSVTVSELPEAADLLNQLKGQRKKSRADLADINAILGLLADENGSNPV